MSLASTWSSNSSSYSLLFSSLDIWFLFFASLSPFSLTDDFRSCNRGDVTSTELWLFWFWLSLPVIVDLYLLNLLLLLSSGLRLGLECLLCLLSGDTWLMPNLLTRLELLPSDDILLFYYICGTIWTIPLLFCIWFFFLSFAFGWPSCSFVYWYFRSISMDAKIFFYFCMNLSWSTSSSSSSSEIGSSSSLLCFTDTKYFIPALFESFSLKLPSGFATLTSFWPLCDLWFYSVCLETPARLFFSLDLSFSLACSAFWRTFFLMLLRYSLPAPRMPERVPNPALLPSLC